MTARAEGRPSQALKPVDAVLLALAPGTCALLAGFGAGVLANLLWAAPAALLAESVARRVAGQDVHAALRDRSTLLVALLLSVSLPPASPWWLAAGAALVAVGVARRLPDGSGGMLKLAGKPLKMSAFADPPTRPPAPDLDSDRDAILSYLGG